MERCCTPLLTTIWLIRVKNTWYEWLINDIPAPIRKAASNFKDKVVNFIKTNTLGNYSKQTVGRRKRSSKLKILKQSEKDNINKNIRNTFRLKNENEAIKYRTIRAIKLIFEQADDYNKLIIFGKTTISNMKVTAIKIKTYQE